MELEANTAIRENGPETEFSSRWEILRPLQATRYRSSYIARSLREDLADHKVTLTVCRYEERLLGNANYVENVRKRLRHEAEMLALPLNFLPEAVDLFESRNRQEKFTFSGGKQLAESEPVLVTESFAGLPLEELVAKGTLDEVRALRIGLRLCDLLNDLHRWNVIALELRPEDLLIDETDHDRMWVASCANYQRTSAKGTVDAQSLVVPLSDFAFAAPEVEKGSGRLDRRVDIYSLGAMVHYLLTGITARALRLEKKPSWRAIGHLSLETQTFIRRCLALDPVARFDETKSARSAIRSALVNALEVAEGRKGAQRPLPAVTAPGALAVEKAARTTTAAPADDPLLPGLVKIALLPVTAPMQALRWIFSDPTGSARP